MLHEDRIKLKVLKILKSESCNDKVNKINKILNSDNVASLDLQNCLIDYNEVTVLAQAFQGTPLTSLNLSHNHMGPKEVLVLAQALKNTQVSDLDLRHNEIGTKGAIAFVKALRGSPVTNLNLMWNHIDSQGALDLGDAFQGTQVKYLNLECNQLGAKASDLVKGLQGTPMISLDFGHNRIGPQGALALIKELQKTKVTKLNLSENHINREWAAIVKELQNTKVTSLDLSANGIYGKCAVDIVKGLQGTKVINLILSSNSIDYEGTIGLGPALQGTNVSSLDLSYNFISTQGAVALVEMLPEQVKHLNFRSNQIGTEGAAALDALETLGQALQRSQVTTCDFTFNKVGPNGVVVFLNNIQGSQITELDFTGNEIDAQGAQAAVLGDRIGKALQNTQVASLNFSLNYIAPEGVVTLTQALQNTQVTTCYLDRLGVEIETAKLDLVLDANRERIANERILAYVLMRQYYKNREARPAMDASLEVGNKSEASLFSKILGYFSKISAYFFGVNQPKYAGKILLNRRLPEELFLKIMSYVPSLRSPARDLNQTVNVRDPNTPIIQRFSKIYSECHQSESPLLTPRAFFLGSQVQEQNRLKQKAHQKLEQEESLPSNSDSSPLDSSSPRSFKRLRIKGSKMPTKP